MIRTTVAVGTALVLLMFCGPLPASPHFRCSSCGRTFDQGYQIEGKPFCSEHWREALPLCANCGETIEGNYSLVGSPARTVCLLCAANNPTCFFCAAPADLERGGVLLPDGRPLCARDRSQAVFDAGVAVSIFDRAVRETVATFGPGLSLKTPVKDVKLVDLAGLMTASNGQYQRAALLSGRLLGLTTLVLKNRGENRWTEAATVHLLNGVPGERMLTVSVHEYAHIWHAENHPRYALTTPIMREGFAEWVAYKVSQRQHREEQVAQLENPGGEVYFQGLMKFRQMESEEGSAGVLRYALSETDL